MAFRPNRRVWDSGYCRVEVGSGSRRWNMEKRTKTGMAEVVKTEEDVVADVDDDLVRALYVRGSEGSFPI